MTFFRSIRLTVSAGFLALSGAALIAASATPARADVLCQSWTGRICAKTSECTGDIIRQCTSYYYYYGDVQIT